MTNACVGGGYKATARRHEGAAGRGKPEIEEQEREGEKGTEGSFRQERKVVDSQIKKVTENPNKDTQDNVAASNNNAAASSDSASNPKKRKAKPKGPSAQDSVKRRLKADSTPK